MSDNVIQFPNSRSRHPSRSLYASGRRDEREAVIAYLRAQDDPRAYDIADGKHLKR